MTDFLTRLAQRTLGLVPVVQPRIDSYYAPATEAAIATTLEPFAITQTATTPPDVSTSQATPQAVSLSSFELPLAKNAPQRPATPPSPTIPDLNLETRSTFLVDQLESTLPSSQELPHINSEQPDPASQSTSSFPTNLSVNSVESFPFPPKQLLENQAISPVVQASQRVELQQLHLSVNLAESSPPQHPSLPQTASPSQSPSIHLPVTPLIAHPSSLPLVDVQEVRVGSPSVTPTDRTTSGLTTSQASLRHLSSTAVQPIAQPEPIPEPIIEIRIGRIEVRGIQPETSKPRPKSTLSTPALSLSDYLTQRDGG